MAEADRRPNPIALESPMPVSPELLEILVCPETKQPVALANKFISVKRVNNHHPRYKSNPAE